MLLMKKDMGGAANVLGLARMIMDAGPARCACACSIPAVENAISGNAFRPGDVLTSRKGLTVEIGNTDAEGRLILADALALADEEAPELLIDMATLTGAARVALGPDLPPFFTDDERFAADLADGLRGDGRSALAAAARAALRARLASKIADVNNVTAGGFAGAITAALFLAALRGEGRELGASRHLRLAAAAPRRSARSAARRKASARSSPSSRRGIRHGR